MSFERSCGLRIISCMCSVVTRHVLACASAIVLLSSSDICAGSEKLWLGSNEDLSHRNSHLCQDLRVILNRKNTYSKYLHNHFHTKCWNVLHYKLLHEQQQKCSFFHLHQNNLCSNSTSKDGVMESNHRIMGKTTQHELLTAKIVFKLTQILMDTTPHPPTKTITYNTYSFGHKVLHSACVADDAWFGE